MSAGDIEAARTPRRPAGRRKMAGCPDRRWRDALRGTLFHRLVHDL